MGKRHNPDENPPDGITVRFGFRYPVSGDKEHTGVVRGHAIWSRTNPNFKLTNLSSRWLLWWEEA